MADSKTQRRGLGRGLGSLIQSTAVPEEQGAAGEPTSETAPAATDTGLAPAPGASFAVFPVDRISPNAAQPRSVFDEEAMAALAHSIQEVGLLQPVVVRPAGADEVGPRYELVMGERRWRAAQQAGLTTIPAIIRETDDTDMLRDALLENLHRSQLNPLEEAAAYSQLLEDFGCTHEELADAHRSLPAADLEHHPAAQALTGRPAPGRGRHLVGRPRRGRSSAVEDPDLQDRLAARVVAEGISVRGLEEIVAVGVEDSQAARTVLARRPTAPGLAGSRIASRSGSRLGSRWTSAGARARSPWSSRRSTTCVGSWRSWTRGP